MFAKKLSNRAAAIIEISALSKSPANFWKNRATLIMYTVGKKRAGDFDNYAFFE